MKSTQVVIKTLLAFAVILMVPSCAVNPVTGKKQLMLMSEAQEIATGKQYDPQVVASFGQYQNDQLLRFIQSKGNEMGKLSHRPNLQYHFKILDTPVVNAFAVPGGYIYFTRGILAQFNNEAELMGVLGHEMGHITARHTASQQSKQQLGQLLLVGGMMASEDFRNLAGYAMQGMELLFLKYSRDNEREADRLGVEYASKIRYDAQKMADFFSVLNKMSGGSDHGGIPSFLSTHPDPGDRQVAVAQQTNRWKTSLGYSDWQVNEDSYLHMIDGMVYGEDPRQGYVDRNVFYHPELKFSFPVPAGWKLENSPLQVQMAPEDGRAMMIFMMGKQASAAETAETTLKELNLTAISSKQAKVNGLPAIAVISQQVSQNQQTGEQQAIKVMSYFIEYGGAVYIFHGVSNDADFNTFARNFESTMMKFNRLTDSSKLNVKPRRIQVKKVQQNMTVANAFKYFGVPQDQMQELALLNNMELTDRLQKGKLIKIVGK
ncbi:Putative Zn-dependent protease [Mariniphaga anaerophila]|uniref:Putative Zn-dependent protease n=1 Tax=Mariniphaga anaerophila TaxID=1484053 RepID=A0A1M5EFE0_9BACT|nr:M48 family metalloprotease [Mariniphaga anaerophila]SHF77949.1 Putative Zn-dependent protease [Mariniphaga anaerophila]